MAIISLNIFANYDADWSRTATIRSGENRANVFNLSPVEFDQVKIKGLNHAGKYPITVTGLLIPYQPLMNVLESNPSNPIRIIFY